MNLKEGFTKIINEYPEIRKYVNIKNKPEKGLVNPKMEDKRREYTKFLSKFIKSIQELLSVNMNISYNVKSSNLGQAADIVQYITITDPNNSSINKNYYIAYLFKPDSPGFYLSLGLGVNQFKKSNTSYFNKDILARIKTISKDFRNYVKNINNTDTESNLDFSKYDEVCNLESAENLPKAYSAGNIYCKYYELNENKNIFLPSESELEEDLIEFIELYQYFSKHNDYFKSLINNSPELEENRGSDSFYNFLEGKGYYFDIETIENFLLSLKVKPFVILTGTSGTGKTKLSQLFAQYMNERNKDEKNYILIPVGANWTENRHILGYFNIIHNTPQYTPAYHLIKNAQTKSYPYFLILDEMNLSHVERYFADFLSAIESKESILLHGEEELKLPNNLFIIGTVNVDETTYMFSPKVLDRANTIEFETPSVIKYMNEEITIEKPKGDTNFLEDVLLGSEVQKQTINELKRTLPETDWNNISKELNNFQKILSKTGFGFGYRVINEIIRFMAVAYQYEECDKNWDWKRYFDAQIKQKMLPKLHGSQKSIGETLNELISACEDYPNSKAKIIEMQNVLNKQKYVSFIN